MRDKAIIGVFMTLLLVPFGCFWAGIGTRPSEYEADRIHSKPRLTSVGGTANFIGGWLDYFGDHFGLRAGFVRAHALIAVRVLHMSPSPAVIVGRDRWLYYADDSSLEDYQTAEPFTTEDLETWRRALLKERDWLRSRGIQFVFMVVPDKHVIYPEYLPSSIHRWHDEYRSEQLVSYLRATTDLTVVDTRASLMARKPVERLYSTTDTHWNNRGAYVGYQALLEAAGQLVPGLAPLPRTAFAPTENDDRGGDLAAMLGLDDVLEEHVLNFVPREPRRAMLREPADLHEGYDVARVVTEIPGARLPRAVIFRDSFMSALVPFVSEHFSRAVYMWQNDVDLDLVALERPDVVILEIVGRREQTYMP